MESWCIHISSSHTYSVEGFKLLQNYFVIYFFEVLTLYIPDHILTLC